MKTAEDIHKIWLMSENAFAAIADEWNADMKYYEDLAKRSAIVSDKFYYRYKKARKQLRKLRQELAEAKGLAGVYYHQKGMHEETISRLENLIERIAKVKK